MPPGNAAFEAPSQETKLARGPKNPLVFWKKDLAVKTGEHTNKHGVRVTEHTCETCGVTFTVCPGIDDYPDFLSEECDSYDPDSELSDEEIEALLNAHQPGPRMVIH